MRNLLFVVLTTLVAVGACDFTKKLTAEEVLVGTLLSTPTIDVRPAAFIPDAGMLALDAGTQTIPAQIVAYAFFGSREGQNLDQAPTPIADATVTVGAAGQTAVALNNDGNGNYSKTGGADAGLTYQGGATYEFTATRAGEAFIGEVTEAPTTESIAAFHSGVISVTANTPYTFTRPEPPAGKSRNLGFVTVFPVSNSGDRGKPTYTNVPSDALGFLKLIAAPGEWQTAQVTLPGTAFPQANGNYVILFSSVKNGGPRTTNLFIGSALLVGTADVGLVRTK
ncbi:MAG: hypothetical protein ACT4TC_09025 [Myxococcaceae bacterium]